MKRGKATLWIAPSFNDPLTIERIKLMFGLIGDRVTVEVKVDSSPHYASESYINAKRIIEEHKELFERFKGK